MTAWGPERGLSGAARSLSGRARARSASATFPLLSDRANSNGATITSERPVHPTGVDEWRAEPPS